MVPAKKEEEYIPVMSRQTRQRIRRHGTADMMRDDSGAAARLASEAGLEEKERKRPEISTDAGTAVGENGSTQK